MADPRETRVLLEHAEDPALRTLDGYKGLVGGYATLEKAYREMEQDEVLKELEDSGLRGRGGAGFSMGKKASFLPRGEMAKYLCCNADESEPGAFKDRELMQRNPHQLIEGIAIAALAADAGHAFIFIRGEYDLAGRHPRRRGRRSLRGGLPRREHPRHATATSSWSSTAAPAPTSAARRRRCSTRSRASAATRA